MDESKENAISKTYRQLADEWIAQRDYSTSEADMVVEQFAQYLDSMPVLFPHLKLLIMEQARKVDRELLEGLVELLPVEEVEKVARRVQSKHKPIKNKVVINETKDEENQG